jgi:hypothetical protein
MSNDLFIQLQNWLSAEEKDFAADETNAVRLPMDGENGYWLMRMLCESEPDMLHVICLLPLTVPEELLHKTAMMLHELNRGVRMGVFTVDAKERRIHFRLSMCIDLEQDLPRQFNRALAIAVVTFDSQLRTLAAAVSGTETVKRFLDDCYTPHPGKLVGSRSRMELN